MNKDLINVPLLDENYDLEDEKQPKKTHLIDKSLVSHLTIRRNLGQQLLGSFSQIGPNRGLDVTRLHTGDFDAIHRQLLALSLSDAMDCKLGGMIRQPEWDHNSATSRTYRGIL